MIETRCYKSASYMVLSVTLKVAERETGFSIRIDIITLVRQNLPKFQLERVRIEPKINIDVIFFLGTSHFLDFQHFLES